MTDLSTISTPDLQALKLRTAWPRGQWGAGAANGVTSDRVSISGRQSDFASVLGQAESARPRAGGSSTEPTTRESRARSAAEQFVSVALVQPILQKLREGNQAAPPFAPTQAQKQFQSLADAEVSLRLVRASRFPMVDRLASDLLKHQSAARSAAQEPTPGVLA